ncbi:MAG TPA: sulfotransferase [Bryobacteraceae bacterium]|nr:sulfotransferase [Bryobacteraceae bacterium]
MATLPNFFLVGAPKAGTTSLYFYLDQHPQVYMSPIKEPHFLADEIRFENFSPHMQEIAAPGLPALEQYLNGPVLEKFSGGPVSKWEDYLKLFQCATHETAIGEASPCYLWSPSASRNIAGRFPGAKIIMMLRNPIDRAFAQYRHILMFADAAVSFREHMEASLRSDSTRVGDLYPFLGFGLYYEQVKRYLDLFPQERVRIYFYEDFCAAQAPVMRDIFAFLSVEPSFTPDLSKRHMQAFVPRSYALKRLAKSSRVWNWLWPRTPARLRALARKAAFRGRDSFVLEPADRARLIDYYRDDVQKLGSLVNRDLSTWLS